MTAPQDTGTASTEDDADDEPRIESQFALVRLLIGLKEIREQAPVEDDDEAVR